MLQFKSQATRRKRGFTSLAGARVSDGRERAGSGGKLKKPEEVGREEIASAKILTAIIENHILEDNLVIIKYVLNAVVR